MSLVLDALKKLDRDKEAGEPGVLVVGAVPWPGVRRHRPLRALAAGALLVLVLAGVGLGVLWRSRTAPLRREAPSEAGAPPKAAAPVTTAAAQTGAAAPFAAAPTQAPPARRLLLPQPATAAAPAASGAEPGEAGPAPHARPQLNAISRQDGRPVAVIDGRLVREGDSIDGVRVLRIGETEVEVEVRGVRRTLHF